MQDQRYNYQVFTHPQLTGLRDAWVNVWRAPRSEEFSHVMGRAWKNKADADAGVKRNCIYRINVKMKEPWA